VNILAGILNSLIILSSVFLVLLVLIQRGKGGGLAGAFGGVGGSSAFGTKAGDVFTKVTMTVATFWILLCMVMVILTNSGRQSAWEDDASSTRVNRSTSSSSTTGVDGKAKSPSTSTEKAPASAAVPPAPPIEPPPIAPASPPASSK